MKKVCLITGASSGIGLATALELRRRGHVVYGAARRVERMEPIKDAGGRALRMDGAVEDVPLDRAREEFEVNLFAPARLAQLVLPHMREQGSGTIVNVSSIGGEIALPLGAWYYASKHALEALSDTLRMETGPFGIDVVVVQPGIIKTGFEDRTAAQLREYSGAGAYGHMAEKMAAQSETGLADGSDPAVVAEAVREAIEAERPETRYAVGHLAEQLLELNRTLPDREFDELASRAVR